jgi:very-short-patch-repair endonuclease
MSIPPPPLSRGEKFRLRAQLVGLNEGCVPAPNPAQIPNCAKKIHHPVRNSVSQPGKTVHTCTMRNRIFPYNPELKEKARKLRNNSTRSEIILWKYLKGKQICGVDFHRQKPVGSYILDFFCPAVFLGIELDGYTHNFSDVTRKDALKERQMMSYGIEVIRFWDEDVYYDLDNVLRVIEIMVEERKEK